MHFKCAQNAVINTDGFAGRLQNISQREEGGAGGGGGGGKL